MNSRVAFCIVILAGVLLDFGRPPAVSASVPAIVYPPTPRTNDTDSYFGTTVPNPYRWLEQTQKSRIAFALLAFDFCADGLRSPERYVRHRLCSCPPGRVASADGDP